MFGLCRIATGAALFALDPYLQVTMSSRTQMQSTKSQPSACVSDCGCHHDDDTSSHTQPSTNKITGKEIVFADKLSKLTKIMDDDTHMVLYKPKSTPGFIKKLSDQSILLPEHLSFEGMVPALPGLVAEVLKKYIHVPYPIRSRPSALNEDEIDELVEYVDQIVQVFTDIAIESGYINESDDTIPYVHVKIAVMTTDGCRYWHQDCVPFRLLSTLKGPCTEYVLPQHSRATLENRQNNSKHAKPMNLGDVAIFKGRGDADATQIHNMPGIVHRSPRLDDTGLNRLLLVVDIPQEGWHFD